MIDTFVVLFSILLVFLVMILLLSSKILSTQFKISKLSMSLNGWLIDDENEGDANE